MGVSKCSTVVQLLDSLAAIRHKSKQSNVISGMGSFTYEQFECSCDAMNIIKRFQGSSHFCSKRKY